MDTFDSTLRQSLENKIKDRVEAIWLEARERLIRDIDKQAAQICASISLQIFRTVSLEYNNQSLTIQVKLPEGEQAK